MTKSLSLLERIRNYDQANPLQMWVIQVAIILAIFLTLARSDIRLMVFTISLVTGRSLSLPLLRFAEEEQRRDRVNPSREFAIALLALFFAACSIGGVTVAILSHGKWGTALMLPISILLSFALGLGIAARRHPLGQGVAFGTAALIILGPLASTAIRVTHLFGHH
ncbi:MAG: hypothetical protein JWQ02_2729 [Capsulimonas sp.]|nr:hypothetical protein [Capsulimonas sp.]